MESSEHEHLASVVALPAAWEDRAPSPCPHANFLQGISTLPSPLTFSEYFQDTLSAGPSQDHHLEFMMFQLATLSNLQNPEFASNSLSSDPLMSPRQSDHHQNMTSFSMELAMSTHSRTNVSEKSLPTDPLATQTNEQTAAAVHDAAQNTQLQSRKPLSRHQIYRMHVKAKAKFKHLSHQIQNEHIKMMNEAVLRMENKLKAKDEQILILLAEIDKLKKQNKR